MGFSTDVGRRAALHALNRIGFGPRPGEIDAVLRRGLDGWVREQLDPGVDTDAEAQLRGFTTLGYPLAQVVAAYQADQRSVNPVIAELMAARLLRAVFGRNQLEEALVDFWFNHFNVFVGDGFTRAALAAYERDAIRPHVLGRFRALLGATARHAAMLYYLDNYLSTGPRRDPRTGQLVSGLNENYGRELLELHTLGVDAGYTQRDVIDAARALTGWTIDLRGGGGFVFRAQSHDTGSKSVFGLELPAGGGVEDGERLLDHLASRPATASFVAYRLCQRFVADDPPESLVARTANAFLASDGDLREVMTALLGSAEFWAEGFRGAKPRTPYEFVVAALRAVDAEVSDARAPLAALQAMGMPLYACAPPPGYSNRGDDWLNASSLLARMNFALELAAGRLRGVRVAPGAGTAAGGDAAAIAAAVDTDLFAGGLSSATLAAASRVPGSGSALAGRLVGAILASPDFQRR